MLVFTLNTPSLFLTNSQVQAVHAVKALQPDREARGMCGIQLKDQWLNYILQSHRASDRASSRAYGGSYHCVSGKIETNIDNWSVKMWIFPFKKQLNNMLTRYRFNSSLRAQLYASCNDYKAWERLDGCAWSKFLKDVQWRRQLRPSSAGSPTVHVSTLNEERVAL